MARGSVVDGLLLYWWCTETCVQKQMGSTHVWCHGVFVLMCLCWCVCVDAFVFVLCVCVLEGS